MNKGFLLFLGIVVSAGGGLLARQYFAPEAASPAMIAFAECLREKGATMYGAYWCPHCVNEKRAFGDSFHYVPYVECTTETQKCLAVKIEGYPTWIFPDGRRLEGEQGIERLAEASGCPSPDVKPLP